MGKCLQITFGIINFLLWLGGAGLFGLSVWLLVNPESFFDFAEDTNNLINGDNATLPEELTVFTDKIANGLYLSMAAGESHHISTYYMLYIIKFLILFKV